MATYTLSVLDILQQNSNGRTIDVMQPDGMANIAAIAKEAIFSPVALSAIAEEHRDAFVTGFCLNFYFEEIGVETLAGWRQLLAGSVFTSADFINQVYEQLDAQIFSRYATRRVDREGEEVRKDDGFETADNFSKDNKADLTKEGGSGRVETGSDATGKSKTVLDGKGKSTTIHGRKDTTDMKTVDTYDNVKDQRGGDVEVTNDSKLSFPEARTTTTAGNDLTKFSDTPQQGRSGLIDGDYLTNATAVNRGDTTTQGGAELTAGGSTTTDTSHSTRTGKVDNKVDGSTTASGTDVVDDKKDDLTQGDTEDARDETQLTVREFETEATGEGTGDSADTRTKENNGRTDSKGNENETSREITQEAIMLAQPLLGRVWSVFDDLFLYIL